VRIMSLNSLEEIVAGYHGLPSGGLTTLTAGQQKIDHQFEGSIDSANRSEDAPSFMKVE
jgi:hypothetical protein